MKDRSRGLGWMLVVAVFCGVSSRPSPEGTITQTGEPSHFQVDDKAAEIEVNANPAGVKVNAKPASLQVVAKPGAPAIPIFHPSIQLAPHYSQPPIVHRQPAMSYLGPQYPFSPFGGFDSGLRRNQLAKPSSYRTENQKRWYLQPVSSSNQRNPGASRQGFVNQKQWLQNSRPFVRTGVPYTPAYGRMDGVANTNNRAVNNPWSNRRVVIPHASPMMLPKYASNIQRGKVANIRNVIPIAAGNNNKRSEIARAPTGLPVYPGYAKRQEIPHVHAHEKTGGTPLKSNSKSGIPRPNNHHTNSRKRQFIQSVPQGYHTQDLVGLYGGYGFSPRYPSLSPYGALPSRSRMLQRAPLARGLIPGFAGFQDGGLGGLAGYGGPQGGGFGGLSGYGGSQGSSLGGLAGLTGGSLGGLSGYGGVSPSLSSLASKIGLSSITGYNEPSNTNPLSYPQQYSPLGLSSVGGYSQGGTGGLISPFGDQGLQGLGALGGSSETSRGYTRSFVSNPYSALAGLGLNPSALSSSDQSALSSLYSGLLGLKPLQSNKMSLAQMYGGSPMTSLGGYQGMVTQQSPYASPYMGLGLDGMRKKSKVPGSKDKKKSKVPEPSKRTKRQLLLPAEDQGGLDLGALQGLQDDLINQYKRELILGNSLQPNPASPIADLPVQQPFTLPQLQGLEQSLASTQQSSNPLLQRLNLGALNANYISPLDNPRMMTSPQLPQQRMTSPFMQERLPMLRSSYVSPPIRPRFSSLRTAPPLARGGIGQQGTFEDTANVSPEYFKEDYRSPVEFEHPHYRRKLHRHPLFRRRLHRPRDYDDDEEEDEEGDEDDASYYREPYGHESVSVDGSYSDKEVPSNRGETLVDSDDLGFGPITVEAKTAEGARRSHNHDISRSRIAKPSTERKMRDRHNDIPSRPLET